ncbi:hypothetical protein Pfo_001568 [Paulownia fortunei]|nr:hypothetical protein Pfo_001568 [Paulownia fortunei]
MATDSTAVLTFHDPFEEIPSTDPSSSFFAENPTLGPSELPFNEEQNYSNCPNHQPGHELNDILDPEDPLSDPVIWAFCNGTDDVTGNSRAGHSGFPGEGCSSHGINDNCSRPENPVFGDHSMPLSAFSVPLSQYNCTCCQILREITHTNGMNVKRLEIHGRFGVITHAVLGIYDFGSSFQGQGQDFQMFDFHKESTQIVKKFMVQYFEACKQEGYNTLQDTLSTFYEALCVGLNEPDNPDDFLQLSPENIGDCPNNQEETMKQPEGGSKQVGFMKIPLAMQRERTRKLQLKDFIDYFHLPIEDAARKMNICPTVMKKICRRNGVLRWPYRKIKSIERKLSKKVEILGASDSEERTRTLEEIQKHQQELANIYEACSQ